MKNCNLHKDPRPHVCHDCARNQRDERLIVTNGPMRVTDEDRGRFRIELSTERGMPTTIRRTR